MRPHNMDVDTQARACKPSNAVDVHPGKCHDNCWCRIRVSSSRGVGRGNSRSRCITSVVVQVSGVERHALRMWRSAGADKSHSRCERKCTRRPLATGSLSPHHLMCSSTRTCIDRVVTICGCLSFPFRINVYPLLREPMEQGDTAVCKDN